MGRKRAKSKGVKKQQHNPECSKGSKDTNSGDTAETDLIPNGTSHRPAASTKKPKFTVDQLLDKAESYLDEFNHEMAQRFCQRALDTDPNNLRALETCGALLLELDDMENAKQCFARAISLEPDTGHGKYMNMGQMLTGQDAIASFTRGAQIMEKQLQEAGASSNPDVTSEDLSNAYCSIAEIYLTDECMLDDAEVKCQEALEKAIKANPESSEAYQLMGSFFLSTDDKQKAREMLEKSVSLWLPALREASMPDGGEVDLVHVCPVSYPSRMNAAKLLIEVENYEVAEEILERLSEEDDEVTEVFYFLGLLHYLQKEAESNRTRHARWYLGHAKEVAKKVKFDGTEVLQHIDALLEDLGPGPTESDDEIEDDQTENSEDDDMQPNSADKDNQVEAMEH